MMPGEDGLALCRMIRETTEIPVILLTAMVEETDRVVGLEIGADDYVTKPFSPRELLARIKAVLRRSRSLPRTAPAAGGAGSASTAGRSIRSAASWSARTASRCRSRTTEFRLLTVFLERARMVLSRDQLLDLTSGRSLEPFERSIDNQVSRLRKKIESDPKNPAIIKTVWGGGYVLAAEVTEAGA